MIKQAGTDDRRIAEIEDEFPAWWVWVSDTGRWWASLRDTLTAAQVAAGCTPYLRADDPDGLARGLRELQAVMEDTKRGGATA